MPHITLPIYLEVGKKRVFASAIDWPGWSRSAKTPELAIEALAGYATRYQQVAKRAGFDLPTAQFEVVEQVSGTSTTDFGAPDRPTTTDAHPVTASSGRRLASLVAASWESLDDMAAAAPAELRKGPRGGGRDRDVMYQHVVAAEAAYARKLGVAHPTPKRGDADAVQIMRDAILDALRAPESDNVAAWSRPYAARRIAWHVLDHAWEMQDRSSPEG